CSLAVWAEIDGGERVVRPGQSWIDLDRASEIRRGAGEITGAELVDAQVFVRGRRRRVELEDMFERRAGLAMAALPRVGDSERIVGVGVVRGRREDSLQHC